MTAKSLPKDTPVSLSLRAIGRLRARVVKSSDGSVEYTLARTVGGILVQRAQLHEGKGQVIQSAVFPDEESFTRWCDADPIRFQHPHVHQTLKRHGEVLFGGDD